MRRHSDAALNYCILLTDLVSGATDSSLFNYCPEWLKRTIFKLTIGQDGKSSYKGTYKQIIRDTNLPKSLIKLKKN